MRPPALGTLLVVCLLAAPSIAQVDYLPTQPPATFATDRTWYRNGDPIPFAGDLYFPAGPTVYFSEHTMVPTGEYDGVILYADTTIEPYSVVFVPIGDGRLRPYQRWQPEQPRGSSYGALPGPQPGFQGRPQHQPSQRDPMATRVPQGQPQPEEPFEPYGQRVSGVLLETVRRPVDTPGIWISFQGFRWQQAGEAVPLDRSRLVGMGTYHGVPVYADARTPYVIYLPSLGDLVAQFKRMP